MLDEQITEKILAACFDVINELGIGFLESVYEKALVIALRDRGLSVATQRPVPVYFRGQNVGEFYPDLIVEEKIVLELKAVKSLAPEHLAQVINYLRGTRLQTALLINFGKQKLEYRRLFNKVERLY